MPFLLRRWRSVFRRRHAEEESGERDQPQKKNDADAAAATRGGKPQKEEWAVSAEQHEAAMESLRTHGFVVLKGVVAESEVHRFREQAVAPALARAGRSLVDANTWPGGEGEMVKATELDDVHGDWYPIPLSSPDGRWPAFFESSALNGFLNYIHGGMNNWEWNDGARNGCGWIHLRYPVAETIEETRSSPGGWHIDGQSDLSSPPFYRSVVCLPLVTPIAQGGGGTALAVGSHLEVARALNARDLRVDQLASRLARRCDVAYATGDEGDVLVMHPFLVHSASRAMRGQPVRVSFNLATRWKAEGGSPVDDASPLGQTLSLPPPSEP